MRQMNVKNRIIKSREGLMVTIWLCICLLLVGCSNGPGSASNGTQDEETDSKKSSIEASGFVLEVNVPTVIEEGELIHVKATLKYNGKEEIELYHGEPIIRLSYSGEPGEKEYNDLGKQSTLQSGDKIVIKENFKAMKPGNYKLFASTTILKVGGEYIEGKGNEHAIKDDMNEIAKKATQSLLKLDPMEIEVREK